MKNKLKTFLKGSPVLVGLFLGALLIVIFIASRQSPEWVETKNSPLLVQVIEAQLLPFRVEARGHGVARPTETWQATANVMGRVVERHAELESGTIISAGSLLVALDPSRYELAIADAQAEINSVQTEQRKLNLEQLNTQRLLELEQARLALSEQELSRQQRLAEVGTVSQTRLDEQHRATLAQRQAVTTLENNLSLIPAQLDMLTARLARAKVRLAQSERDLQDTRFLAPYDLRLGPVEVQLHQFVAVGQRLFQADNISTAEVEARIPFSQLSRLLGNVSSKSRDAITIAERLDLSVLDARLELVGATGVAWPGKVVRIASGLDPKTRAVRVVVRVERPYENIQLPHKPALQRDMYTRVVISTHSEAPLLAIPASAVHQGEVWLVNSQQQLERRVVQVDFEQNGLAVITAGIEPGELVIVDDIASAIQGTLVLPQRNEALEHRIVSLAAGEQQ